MGCIDSHSYKFDPQYECKFERNMKVPWIRGIYHCLCSVIGWQCRQKSLWLAVHLRKLFCLSIENINLSEESNSKLLLNFWWKAATWFKFQQLYSFSYFLFVTCHLTNEVHCTIILINSFWMKVVFLYVQILSVHFSFCLLTDLEIQKGASRNTFISKIAITFQSQ